MVVAGGEYKVMNMWVSEAFNYSKTRLTRCICGVCPVSMLSSYFSPPDFGCTALHCTQGIKVHVW